jgi:hypothetical protein
MGQRVSVERRRTRFGDCVLMHTPTDYVVLENLLLLVLIVAPKFEFMDKRSAFMREVFVTNCPEDTICGETLARILTKPTERDSDLLQAQAIDILAKSKFMLYVDKWFGANFR